MASGIACNQGLGAVFSSMEHLDGRRPPHAKDRSALAKRARSDRLQRAELMANLVERIAAEGITSVDGVARTARETLATLPEHASTRRG
jgi:hypothetical protein